MSYLIFKQFYEGSYNNRPVLQIRKLRHRLVKWLAQDYTSDKYQSLDSKASHLAPIQIKIFPFLNFFFSITQKFRGEKWNSNFLPYNQ